MEKSIVSCRFARQKPYSIEKNVRWSDGSYIYIYVYNYITPKDGHLSHGQHSGSTEISYLFTSNDSFLQPNSLTGNPQTEEKKHWTKNMQPLQCHYDYRFNPFNQEKNTIWLFNIAMENNNF